MKQNVESHMLIINSSLMSIAIATLARLFIIVGIALSSIVCAAPHLTVAISGIAGSDCYRQRHDVKLAGSQCEIVLTIIPGTESVTYHGLPTDPSANLTLSAGLRPEQEETPSSKLDRFRDQENVPFQQGVLERLDPYFYVTGTQVWRDEAYQKTGFIFQEYRKPQYHFLITIPDDFAGQLLCVQAVLDDPVYGHLEGFDCARIVAPCSEGDRNHVSGTYIYFAHASRNYERAITLTDSLLSTGWLWPQGIQNALYSARALGQWDQALKYLDLFYSTYGRISSDGPLDPARETQTYQHAREELLEQINKQRQPQR